MNKVLIIEDDLQLSDIYQKRFEMDRYNVITAFNGQDGIEKAKSENPDLILLDVLMPVMDGLETLELLKKDNKTSKIPVVMLTVLKDKQKANKALHLGAIDYIVKSDIEPSQLVEKIKKLLWGSKEDKRDKILIVEDDNQLAKIYQTKLTIDGFISDIAADGEEGVKMAQSVLPDLILLDLILPKMDGFDVLENIKNNPKTAKIPVIVFSNLSKPSDISLAKRLGATDYIVKANLTPNEVVEKIKKTLKNKT